MKKFYQWVYYVTFKNLALSKIPRFEKRANHVAGIAQSVEQRIRNAQVGGSNPLSGTIFHFLVNPH
jgi:hypothetical protein